MKIAFASEGKDGESVISEKGGRSPYYLIYENDKLIESIKNPFAFGAGGAGFSVAYMLADKGVDRLFASDIGGNMISALNERGLEYVKVKAEKKISDIIENEKI